MTAFGAMKATAQEYRDEAIKAVGAADEHEGLAAAEQYARATALAAVATAEYLHELNGRLGALTRLLTRRDEET